MPSPMKLGAAGPSAEDESKEEPFLEEKPTLKDLVRWVKEMQQHGKKEQVEMDRRWDRMSAYNVSKFYPIHVLKLV